jgi:hypothetical protein
MVSVSNPVYEEVVGRRSGRAACFPLAQKDSLLRGRNYSFLCPMASGLSINENRRREDKKYEKE